MEFDKEQESSDVMCDVCHKIFRDIGSLKLHQCVHTGERPYHCDVCNKTFRDTSNLKETPLLKIRLCLIGRTFNSVKVLSVCVCVFFINIQHAPLHGSNTTCFRVKYSQYGYMYLQVMFSFFQFL
jgi:hypothetical protein